MFDKDLGKAYGERFAGGNPELLKSMVKSNFLGRKSGKGCFVYDDGLKGDRNVNQGASEIFKQFELTPPNGVSSDEDLQLRLVTRFVNESVFRDELILRQKTSLKFFSHKIYRPYLVFSIMHTHSAVTTP